jgi:polyisoprenyl-teichoic acid--peptidoglycan teichoic acid transferase
MADTQRSGDLVESDDELGAVEVPPKRHRRGLRITLLSLASVIVLLGVAAAGLFLYVNDVVGSIPRVPVKFLVKDSPSDGMTILLTDADDGSAAVNSVKQTAARSGMILLLHIGAGSRAAGAVSIPAGTVVNVPGHGKMRIEDVDAIGGPSLLVKTVHDLTGVPINHFAQIDFVHVAVLVDALGGVSIRLPSASESFGHLFRAGVSQIGGIEALEYTGDPALTEAGRELRQQYLTRVILDKVGSEHLLVDPLKANGVLHALVSMLTVDSNFSNSQVESLATQLGSLAGPASTFITAPTRVANGSEVLEPAPSAALWSAVKNGALAAFAEKYPSSVTASAP